MSKKQLTRFRGNDIPSTLDLIFTNEENMVDNLEYSPGIGSSDHLVISFRFLCYIEINERSNEHLNYNKGNYSQIKDDLINVSDNWDEMTYDKDVDESWNTLAENIIKSIEN